MITLQTTLQKFQILLAGAVSATEGPVTVDYEDIALSTGMRTPKTAQSVTTGNTAVDLLTAPAAGTRRNIRAASFYNADSATATVTFRLNDNGTTRILVTVALLTLESLYYSETQGWFCLDANGNRKMNSAAADSTNISAALSMGTKASSAASLNLVNVATPGSSQASSMAALNPASVSSQASSVAAGIVVASINSVSSQASSIAAAIVPASINSVSALQSGASAQSFTSTNWSVISSATSRTKSSFAW